LTSKEKGNEWEAGPRMMEMLSNDKLDLITLGRFKQPFYGDITNTTCHGWMVFQYVSTGISSRSGLFIEAGQH
jgi:hypothetical protein